MIGAIVAARVDRRDLPAEDHRLRRTRTVDQHDALRLSDAAAWRVNVFSPLADAGRGPVAEALLELRLDLGERQVGDHEDLEIVGPEPALLEADQIVAA